MYFHLFIRKVCPRLGYSVRWDDGAVPVQGFPVYGIRTHGKSQLFLCLQFARTFKVSKQIDGVVLRFFVKCNL